MGPGAAPGSTCPTGGGGSYPPRGAAPRGGPPTRRGPCFLYKKAGGKNRRGFPPAPPGIKPLAGARSIFCVCVFCNHLFLAHVHQTRFGYAYSGKIFFAGYCSVKNPAKENLSKESPQIWVRTWAASNPTAVPLRRYPKRWSERAASGLENRGPGAQPLVFFPPFLT